MVMMQGILWKWTNYLSGWQPRWFILDYGVLAYYRSQEDVHLGSRGSVKMSCCEIIINNSDTVRIDLKIPPENYMYLKASTGAERQKWLVALGTAKACLIDSSYQEHQQQLNSMVFLKDKMKELDLCRGIMLEQVHEIKLSTDKCDKNKPVFEAVTLLSATCDTFLSSLDDIMEILEDNLSTMSESPVSTPRLLKPPHHHHSHKIKSFKGQTPPSTPSSHTGSIAEVHKHHGSSKNSSTSDRSDHSSNSQSSNQMILAPAPNRKPRQDPGIPLVAYDEKNLPLKDLLTQQMQDASIQKSDSSVSSASSLISSPDGSVVVPPLALEHLPDTSSPLTEIPHENVPPPEVFIQSPVQMDSKPVNNEEIISPQEEQRIIGKSFFGKAPTRFEDVQTTSSGLIPTQQFLDACSSIVPVFDSLGATAFAPVKIDIQGNIKKIKVKFETDEVAFRYLQNIVFQELKSNEHNARNSVTDALLWLKRALEFILVFLAEVSEGQKDLAAAAGTAYSKSLRSYHGWMVRGVFALAVRACPYYKDFMIALSKPDSEPPASNKETLEEMASCVEALNKIVSKLNSYYRKNKLDSDVLI